MRSPSPRFAAKRSWAGCSSHIGGQPKRGSRFAPYASCLNLVRRVTTREIEIGAGADRQLPLLSLCGSGATSLFPACYVQAFSLGAPDLQLGMLILAPLLADRQNA